MAAAEPTFDHARIHVEVLGHESAVEFDVRIGPCTLRDLLPTARQITEQIVAIAIEHARAQGKTVSCRTGCGACCRQLVPISPVEAQSLAELVAVMPAQRRTQIQRRFAKAVHTLERAGLLDARMAEGRCALLSSAKQGASAWEDVSRRYFALQIACPFLEQESCSIYPERPLVCREYNAVTPAEWCNELGARVQTTERPARMSEVLGRAANAIAGTSFPGIPLTLSLEWSEVHGRALEGTRDGEQMFWSLLDHLEAGERARAAGPVPHR